MRRKRVDPKTREIGDAAETRALQFLSAQGLRCVARNYRCRYGEIDLICHDGPVLVMVEVRYRRDTRYGSAEESITRAKQARLIAAARHYLLTQRIDAPVRFDVVTLRGDETLNWIRDAFRAEA